MIRGAAVDRYGILKAYSSENRREATDAEYVLWQYLRRSALGVKFRRQHAIADYIADFACITKKLIIEIDGGYHNGQQQIIDDQIRSDRLYRLSYYVLRFTNEEVLNQTDYVINKIKELINKIQ